MLMKPFSKSGPSSRHVKRLPDCRPAKSLEFKYNITNSLLSMVKLLVL
jgi:hypothetical protein